MPSFDVVSEVDQHEIANAVDQANREVGNRFDFKGTGARFEQADGAIQLKAQVEFQLKQMMDILHLKLSKRGIDIACLDEQEAEVSSSEARQRVVVRQGIDAALARKITRLVKDSKIKVQCAVQGDQLRITGKKRDDLQSVIALLKASDIDLPLQYTNFRD